MLTLEDFNKQIMRPMLIKAIKSGAVDHAIATDPICLAIVLEDKELKQALMERLELA
jgi:hypothetical protein